MLKVSVLFVATLAIFALSCAEKDWWENGNFYQIYPRSFQDSNGDGIGDLRGIIGRLQYLRDLDVDGVWLSPIFKSPMYDFGYDISDYKQIQPEYGTVKDLEDLISEAHRLGLRIILDFVPNHTSDEHEWFINSVNGVPEYRDFYVWHDGIVNETTGERQPPNNWKSWFRNSAWEWNDKRQQYYLHQFTVKQPDLNFRNPAVHAALKYILQFWLERGIDGFRIDAVDYMYEAAIDPATGTYPDEPVVDDVSSCPDTEAYCHLKHIYTFAQPESIEMIYDWHDIMEEWKSDHNTDTKILMTEAYTTVENLMPFYGNGVRKGAQIPFNFDTLSGLSNTSDAATYDYYVHRWLDNMPEGSYANWVLGNHDNARVATRFGVQRVDLINIFLQTLPGIAVTFNGEEYGLTNVFVSWEDTVDPQGCGTDPETFNENSRDPERTPFRWDSSPLAGFSTTNDTWLPVGERYENDNVAFQLAAENSHLKIFKQLINLRKSAPAFQLGGYESRVVGNVLIFQRRPPTGDAYIVVLNIGDEDVALKLSELYDNVQIKIEVVISSLQSNIPNGQVLNSSNFLAKAYNGYVLRVVDNSEILRDNA